MRAYVLARKGILASDQSIKDMTPTRWVFEYHALATKEAEQIKLYTKVLKHTLVGIFGLNMLRPTDANGYPKQFEEMSEDEKESFLPLTAWIGREDLLKKVSDQLQKDFDPAMVSADKHYEDLVAAIDAADGDMEPILGLDKIKTPTASVDPRIELEKKALDIKDYSDVDIEGDI